MTIEAILWAIPALPLAGFLVNGLFGDRLSKPAVGAVAVTGPALAFVLSVWALLSVHGAEGPARAFFSWIATGDLSVSFGLLVDPLTAVMLLNVTGVGTAIHLYSYGYMHEDPSFARFMAYLNLFLCAMLILVMGDSLLLLFVGWEGVGLCSYLLIGFWYGDQANVDAGRKAFVVNRIGDLAFLIGAFILFALCGSLDFASMEAAVAGMQMGTVLTTGPLAGWTVQQALALAGLCLFGGATGKSAQIPLYVWLPDAMAGPTPVSALIHAATMVTAGIYLLGRMDFLFVHLPGVTETVAVVAAATALLSGVIAVAQNDIKKVLAYSTVSQLGFMFAGMASMLWTTGLFHVITHAFFKALLFLGAGAVIHAMHHEQDIRKMGGLHKDLRLIAVLFGIGSLALAGVPPFSGFFSKDGILAAVHLQMTVHGGVWGPVFGILVVTAALTAFYTTRLVVLVFFGEPADHHRHLHPVHWTMTSTLVVLAALAAGGGLLGGPIERLTAPGWSEAEWLAEVHGAHDEPAHDAADAHGDDAHADDAHAPAAAAHGDLHHRSHNIAMGFSIAAVVMGIGSGLLVYAGRREWVTAFVAGPGRALHRAVEDKLYVDELYEAMVVNPLSRLSTAMWSVVDRAIIDGALVEGSGQVVIEAGSVLRRVQNGAIGMAAAGTLVGAIGVLLWLGAQ